MDAHDRVDLHDRIMDLLKGRIKMGAGSKKKVVKRKAGVKAGKKNVGRPKKAANKKAGVTAGVKKKAGVTAGRKKATKRRGGMSKEMQLRELMGVGECEAVCSHCQGSGVEAGAKRKKYPLKGRVHVSDWVKFVKKYAKEHNMSYKEALQRAGPSYRRMHK